MTSEPRYHQSALSGFNVLFENELLDARRSKRIIAFLAIMTLSLLLVFVIGYVNVKTFGDGARHVIQQSSMERMVGTWATLVGFMGSLMVIAATVDAVTHERALGITSWIVTKPVSRLSYLSAKASAHAAIACITIVIIPSAIWVTLSLVFFEAVPAAHIIVAAGILCVEMAFLSFVVVALGVVFRSVAPVAVCALAVWFLPNVVPAISSLNWTYRILPSYLPIAALSVALNEKETYALTIPIASIILAALAFAAAVLQFERQEL